MSKVNIFWFRRDLRLDDNRGLFDALSQSFPVLPTFIFDTNILDRLEDRDDARVGFIYQQLVSINKALKNVESSVLIKIGDPLEVFQQLSEEYDLNAVYTNHDYEPYAKERDSMVANFLKEKDVNFYSFKDQVIFERSEVVKPDGEFYKVFTPYKRVWLSTLSDEHLNSYPSEDLLSNFIKNRFDVPSYDALGFKVNHNIKIPSIAISDEIISSYDQTRDFPGDEQGTSRLGVHLRHGSLSIRKLMRKALDLNETYRDELIWREFYMMILDHNPHVVDQAFKPKYDRIEWSNNEDYFEKWCLGLTGFPIVDAGMRQLNQTGYMHNRLRMITSSFLTKVLLVDWRWGEAYFARKLLDYDLSANNGGWQWAAGTGTDAQPYFRIFNPDLQVKKWDPKKVYLNQWIPELTSEEYPSPIVDYKSAKEKALFEYKRALDG
ncbi:cryptochrome/photolyase family protein [Aureibacter tunicatorum]|uniref:Deoxyribodipyrimidine photo-lyase n=1 Tax=Aureibacter tunicatorum TaxID=866807 RepID=A0AAE3XPS4_9BACT|nr:deoxyribodipyrimidine photo-lyase [Aureibacter tunicatorum]MDR6240352.1 deoxyribodipyrimidine photo-lyase [Aureibacter tunicatorum]BDD05767.1 deoxyribodipyrimidine photo-lyase [Aureibacter tunicatorum]